MTTERVNVRGFREARQIVARSLETVDFSATANSLLEDFLAQIAEIPAYISTEVIGQIQASSEPLQVDIEPRKSTYSPFAIADLLKSIVAEQSIRQSRYVGIEIPVRRLGLLCEIAQRSAADQTRESQHLLIIDHHGIAL